MIPITIYARLDAYTQVFVDHRSDVHAEVKKFCSELEAAARVADPSASICEDTGHAEIHVGQDHSEQGEMIFVELGLDDPGAEDSLTDLSLELCVSNGLHALKCFDDGRCKICGFTPKAAAAFRI